MDEATAFSVQPIVIAIVTSQIIKGFYRNDGNSETYDCFATDIGRFRTKKYYQEHR